MKSKKIHSLLPPPPTHMVGDGFRVHNFFPRLSEIGLQGMSPFFLMDYNSQWEITPCEKPRGVGVHPHRGLETVTLAYHGRIAHHDSAGHADVIGEGDVQWMTAGAGVLHKEYHEKEFSRQGGLFQMVQLWVNLPARDKWTPAKYQSILQKEMGRYDLPGNLGEVEIIAGEFHGIRGPAFCFTPIELYNARLETDAAFTLEFPERYNTGILVVKGEALINGTRAPQDHLVYFAREGQGIAVEAKSKTILLVMSGQPIDEPVAAHGPFLMNTRQEIQQAYEDYYAGKFGFLED